jgi:hypothetical protein
VPEQDERNQREVAERTGSLGCRKTIKATAVIKTEKLADHEWESSATTQAQVRRAQAKTILTISLHNKGLSWLNDRKGAKTGSG